MSLLIPKVIHQTWKTADIPSRLRAFAESWLMHNPGWEYRLWTDDDLHAFVATHYPDFLAVYEGYKQPIKRVDAARYLIMRTLGGLYADLDFECFKSIEPLLDGATCAIGLEPDEHLTYEMSRRRGMTRVLCPSLLASVPGHPYWDIVFENLVYYHEVTEVLDATGPFLLSRCLDEMANPDTVRLLAAPDVYPIGFERLKRGELFDFKRWDELTRDATALHHWDGSWVDQQPTTPDTPVAPDFVAPWLREQTVVHPELRGAAISDDPSPRVTALMTTRDRPDQAKLAIDCFRLQTHSNKELVIVDDGDDDTLARHVAALADPAVRIIRVPRRDNLRDVALEASSGEYVIEWEDDALSHPFRIEVQLDHLRRERAQAAVLTRSLLWWVAERRFALGDRRVWERSMLCRKDRHEITQTSCVVEIDLPQLYLHVGANQQLWESAERRYEGLDAERVYRHLVHDFPLVAYPRTP